MAAALVAGYPGEQDRRAVAGGPFDGERPAADDDEHDRRPGSDDRLEKLLLAAEEPEVAAVTGLPCRRVVGQPGPLAEDNDRHVAPRAPARPLRPAPRPSPPGDPGAARVD